MTVHVFLTGATGTVGSRVLSALVARGHDVTAGVRSADKASAIDAAGGTGVVVDFSDRARLVYLMRESDGVIHTAAGGDDPAAFDGGVADAAIEALSGSPKPYVHTGGAWVWGANDAIDEEDPLDPPALTAWRVGVIDRLKAADLALTVVHPGIVYGDGGPSIVSVVVDGPRDEQGRIRLVGSGEQHWTTIDVRDLADLYVAVLESRRGWGDVVGVSGESPTVAEIAATAGEVVAEDDAATRERLGADFADALLTDQRADGAKARSIGDWRPTRPTLIEVLRS